MVQPFCENIRASQNIPARRSAEWKAQGETRDERTIFGNGLALSRVKHYRGLRTVERVEGGGCTVLGGPPGSPRLWVR